MLVKPLFSFSAGNSRRMQYCPNFAYVLLFPNQESLQAIAQPIEDSVIDGKTSKGNSSSNVRIERPMRYWQLVRLNGAGQRQAEEVPIARAFFQDRFAAAAISDAQIQRELLQLLRQDSADRQGAELCLQCFISQQIEQVCVQLERKFGDRHGFTRYDLLPFVLDDDFRAGQRLSHGRVSIPYRSLSCQILQTFNPDRAGLSTWVMRQVRHHPDLRAFLREHGVDLATDWGILNDTQPEQLRQILAEFHTLTPIEIEFAYQLLRGYHAVYRHDRLQKRQLGLLRGKETCTPPTSDQLTRMAEYLQAQLALAFSPEEILSKLQTLASQLRQYRLHRLGGSLPTTSIDQPNASSIVIETQAPASELDDNDEQEFLTFYRHQIVRCLDQSLEQATNDRVTYLQRKKAPMVQSFLTALQLFHCQGQSMDEIAPQVGLQAQFQVTRLMKLKEFRANVRSKLLQLLLDCILDQAKRYTDPTQLQTLNHTLEAVLEEQVSTLLQQAETEAAVAKQRPLTSLFARRLCHYLDTRNDTL